MNTITVNGTTFTGEMILNAVEQTTGFPELGMGSIWYPRQLVTSQEYDSIRQKMWDNRMDLIEDGYIPVGSNCCNIWEKNLAVGDSFMTLMVMGTGTRDALVSKQNWRF